MFQTTNQVMYVASKNMVIQWDISSDLANLCYNLLFSWQFLVWSLSYGASHAMGYLLGFHTINLDEKGSDNHLTINNVVGYSK
jgi:hypothetical protein